MIELSVKKRSSLTKPIRKGFAIKRFSIRVSGIFFPIVPIVNIIILNNDNVVFFVANPLLKTIIYIIEIYCVDIYIYISPGVLLF